MYPNRGYRLPGGLSADLYVEKRLRPVDAENFSAAGLQLYRRHKDSIELLIPRERPWNSFTQAYDPLAWNVLGGKRVPRQDRVAETTAVRCFMECFEQVEGAPKEDVFYQMMPSSFVLWYPAGKFALIVLEATDEMLANFPEQFAAYKEKAGPNEEFRVLPQGIRKYVKQIDAVEWVPAADLVPEPKFVVSDLLSNILQGTQFRRFLNGALDPVVEWPPGSFPDAPPRWDNGNSKGKGWGKQGFRFAGGKKGAQVPMMMGYGPGPPPMMALQTMPPISSLPPLQQMPMYQTPPHSPMGQMAQPVVFPPYQPSSEEMQRQMYGEQLFVQVQPLAPSPYLAQKITGMLLELPHDELVLNLTNQEELHRRVSEAMDVLREDGLVI